MRTLKTKEFNLLRITNIDEFLSVYTNNTSYYSSAFKIMADLEEEIKFHDSFDKLVCIGYKLDGDIFFELVDAYTDEYDRRIVKYKYVGSGS